MSLNDILNQLSFNNTAIRDTFLGSFGVSIGIYVLIFLTLSIGLCLGKFTRLFLSIIAVFTLVNFCILITLFTSSIELMETLKLQQ